MASSKNKKSVGGPEWLWAPLSSAAMTLLVGLVALVAGQPWLFPSLGPTIFLYAHTPGHANARLYNTLVGHGLGVVGAVMGILVAGANDEPSVLSGDVLTAPRLVATVVAMTLCLLLQILARASHPPAAATALLLSLGGFKLNVSDMNAIAVGVVLVALLGEIARRIRLRDPRL